MDMQLIASNKTALLLGATGLVGHEVLNQLLANSAYGHVTAPTRRPLHRQHKKLKNPIVDFSRMERSPELFRCNDVFICLGTTIKKAGSQEAFRTVDYDYIVRGAKLARRGGANQLFLVSSAGADSESRFFYNRVKGQTEEAVTAIDFWAIHVFRPGVLLGNRNERRLAETITGKLTGLIRSISPALLGNYNPTSADVLARRMVAAAQDFSPGVHFHGAEEMVD